MAAKTRSGTGVGPGICKKCLPGLRGSLVIVVLKKSGNALLGVLVRPSAGYNWQKCPTGPWHGAFCLGWL
ncbi:hypothetical protein HYPGJ_30916 [Hyphomicrobium sp. GJ21]|nr:hypothetical protein HYPGJ_30916 [Hyphomicrobium sp. GJ21]